MGTCISSQDNDIYLTTEEFYELLEDTTPSGFVTEYYPRASTYYQNGCVGTYRGKSVYIVAETFSLTDLQEVL